MRPDEDDVAQEVALQRLLGNRVTPSLIRRRMRAEEAQRRDAERRAAEPEGAESPDFSCDSPLLRDKMAGYSNEELMARHGIASPQTLRRRLREAYESHDS